MKKFVAVFFFLLCAITPVYGQSTYYEVQQPEAKPNPADFNIKFHITSSRLVGDGILQVKGILNKKEIILEGNTGPFFHGSSKFSHLGSAPILNTGDYQMRIKKDISEKDGSMIQQTYEVLLPDGIVWLCSIVGISE